MSKRKERFCDMTVQEPLPKNQIHHLAINGRCVEPAVGKCSKCQRDFCSYHSGTGHIELKLHYDVGIWPIPLCEDCAKEVYEKFQKKKILPRRLETGFRHISREVAQWLGEKGHYAPKPTPKTETAPIEPQEPSGGK